MSKYKFISTIDLDNIRGGWSALNNRVFLNLKEKLDISFVLIPDVPVIKHEAFMSRCLRFIGLKGNYFYFSKRRLKNYSKILNEKIRKGDILIFFGSTPYIGSDIDNIYYVISDISFKGYYDNYNKDHFCKTDIKRICDSEAIFLARAQFVFLTSNWASQMICKDYFLSDEKVINIGVSGNISAEFSQGLDNKESILFIANNFETKGGEILFNAFKKLLVVFPYLELNIVGALPPDNVLNYPNVKYHGFLDKSVPLQYKIYCKLLSEATIHLLPTKSDAAPLTIIECGYFGTPSIAPKRFAIPELIGNGISGYLLEENFNSDDLVKLTSDFLCMPFVDKLKLRKKTFQFHKNNNWNIVTSKILINLK